MHPSVRMDAPPPLLFAFAVWGGIIVKLAQQLYSLSGARGLWAISGLIKEAKHFFMGHRCLTRDKVSQPFNRGGGAEEGSGGKGGGDGAAFTHAALRWRRPSNMRA